MAKILNILSALMMIANVGVAVWFYFTTDQIAVAFDWNTVGELDAYGKTWTILALSAVAVLVYLVCLYAQRTAHANLPFKVADTAKVMPRIKALYTKITFFVALLMLYVVMAVAQLYSFHILVVYALIALMLVMYAVDLRAIYKNRK